MISQKTSVKVLTTALLLTSCVAYSQKSATSSTEAPVKQKHPLMTKKSGRAPSADLKIKTSKVPTFDIYQKKVVKGKTETFRVKNIPRLDIGEEPQFIANSEFDVEIPATRKPQAFSIIKRQTPPTLSIEKYLTSAPQPAAEAKQIAKADRMVPDVPTFPLVQDPVFQSEGKVTLVKSEEMTPSRLKLLQALIFLEIKKSYNMALALFAELLDDQEVQTEAQYQLAMSSKGLGLYSEYKHQMMKVLNNPDKVWQSKAALHLAQNAQTADFELVKILDPKIENLKLEVTDADQYQMNRAKYYLEQNNLTLANLALDEIPTTSKLSLDAQFLKSVLLYRGGQLQEAIAGQTLVLKTLMEQNPKSELRSVAALTLARMHFQASQYKEAFDTYLKVDKTYSEWPQAMMEQAWSQILAEDYEGAAGNMFSLHTDFFKNTFAPESYVIRTVSYLNLCQFGDGAKVINDLKRKYTPVNKQMESYASSRKDPLDYYETVKAFAKNPDQKSVDGLPKHFIFELIRHPSFINEQKMINSAEEQVVRYNKIALDLIKQERDTLAAQNTIRNEINKLRKKLDKASNTEAKEKLKEEIASQDRKLNSMKIQYHIAKKARNSIKELRSDGFARLEKEKTEYKMRAAMAVKNRFDNMFNTLKNTIDQSDVLNYELYAGAGEHIRFQTAGGEITDKERAELKPEDKKSLNWDFKGEVWEDELGHYRSSLKNVCPRENISQAEINK
jgi:hypothetical protein